MNNDLEYVKKDIETINLKLDAIAAALQMDFQHTPRKIDLVRPDAEEASE